VEPSVKKRLGAPGGHLELYRLAGIVLGLALRPRYPPDWTPGAHAPYILGDAARLVPSVCRQLLLGDAYVPRLHDLRSGAARRASRKRCCGRRGVAERDQRKARAYGVRARLASRASPTARS
jgi:hypothetical protein